MREILFRGKDKYTGKWVQGDLVHGLMKQKGRMFIWSINEQSPTGITEFEVIPETIGQFTGVLDANGKKIFEGDIVKLTEYVKKVFCVTDGPITYQYGAFFINNGDSLRGTLYALTDYTFVLRGQVIGNIHDNPELLEGK